MSWVRCRLLRHLRLKRFGVFGFGNANQVLNDLVVGRDKLGGILIETVRAGGKTVAVVGIGINFVLPKEVENAASVQSLFQTASRRGNADAAVLLETLLAELGAVLEQYAEEGFAPFLNEYETTNRDHGKAVLLLRDGETVCEGTVKGVDGRGVLHLETAEGEQTVVSGEISLRARRQVGFRAEAAGFGTFFAVGRREQLTKWAWVENGTFATVGSAPYRDLSPLGAEWAEKADGNVRIVGCAVCGESKKAQVKEQLARKIEWLPSSAQALGIRNHYRHPEEHGLTVGSTPWAAAASAATPASSSVAARR